jgi:hypothetical protein
MDVFLWVLPMIATEIIAMDNSRGLYFSGVLYIWLCVIGGQERYGIPLWWGPKPYIHVYMALVGDEVNARLL